MIPDRDEVDRDQVREFFEAHGLAKSPIDIQPSKSAPSKRMRFLNTVRPPKRNDPDGRPVQWIAQMSLVCVHGHISHGAIES
jgi:hypothetical protein